MEDKMEITKKVKFSAVTMLLEKIHQAKTIDKKATLLRTYIESFEKFRQDFKQKHGEQCVASFYPILRLLLPNIDRERESYGIKTTTMGRLYVRILAIDPNGDVAKILNRQHYPNKSTSDYADIVHEVMKNRCSSSCELTVYDVNQHLDTIAYCYQNNDRKKIDDELIKMINGMTAIDQKWLIRIILKHMHLSLGQQKILSVYHPEAKDFYAQYSHLSRVCECIESGEQPKPKGSVEPMQPFRPMLCQRFNISQLDGLLKNKVYYVETKMDGERFQIHMRNDEFKYFSRNGYDFTNMFGSSSIEGTLSPFLVKAFKISVKNIIVDGEMMVWNKDEQMYHTKGENFDVKSLRRDDMNLRPCFCAYDILYLNDSCLTNKPYAERSRLLSSLLGECPGYVTLCTRQKIRDSDHILECLNSAIDSKEEGVVIKEADSTYAPGERNAGWCKIKPDYIDGLVSDFDLLIIGGYMNRRKTMVYSWLLGVLKKTDESNHGILYAVTRVSLGLSHIELVEINNKLKPFWNQCKTIKEGRTARTQNPPNMVFGNSSPDVWIEPKDSIILEIKASEMTKSSSFGTNYTLRFPRVVSIRKDKLWFECCGLDEFDSLCQTSTKVTKITKRHITHSDISKSTHKIPLKRERKPNTAKASSSASNSFANDVENTDIPAIDNICNGLDFCILSTTKDMPTINELKQMVLRHGGRIVENPSNKTYLSIAGDLTWKVRKIIETEAYNVAKVQWLVKALSGPNKQKKLIDLHPRDMHGSTPEFELKFSEKFDNYGDSHTEAISTSDLKEILRNMAVETLPEVDRTDFYILEREMYPDKTNPNMFRLATAFFYLSIEKDFQLNLAKMLFAFKGGKIVEQIGAEYTIDHLSHIIVNPENFDLLKFAEFVPFSGQDLSKCRLVSLQWIFDSCKNARKQSEKLYFINKKN